MENSKKILQLSENDNVFVACRNIESGEVFFYKESSYTIEKSIMLGHKIASRNISKGEDIIKFNVSIGSAVQDIKKGEHVHIHNIKSDFIPTYTLENQPNKIN
jgi:hypothetical protein